MTKPVLFIEQKDIERVTKQLDRWQGKPLANRVGAAIPAGLKLLLGPIRHAAPQPGNERTPRDATGQLSRSTQVWKLKTRPGEVTAWAVGPRGGRSTRLTVAPHRHLVILGHAMVTHAGETVGTVRGIPYVDRVAVSLEPRVLGFIDEQITRLA